ncbi:hypothetical protein EYF80_013548 [Liparis tanakae]|uniref:Uncharacterized protein n=1 Tax=Liparis tanakae TaxID=230148 RepID=A0A4Z2IEF1_9TELE|nr:hypothetical protein EYF80_013548 [Liparis tanakae]
MSRWITLVEVLVGDGERPTWALFVEATADGCCCGVDTNQTSASLQLVSRLTCNGVMSTQRYLPLQEPSTVCTRCRMSQEPPGTTRNHQEPPGT